VGPIPFNDRLMIKTNQGSQEFSVEIFNVLGYMSYERSAIKEDEVEVNTELLKQGVYFLRITDTYGNRFTKRLVKSE